jgi:hypothetical protein
MPMLTLAVGVLTTSIYPNGANQALSHGLVQQDRSFRAKRLTRRHILPGDGDHPQGTAIK